MLSFDVLFFFFYILLIEKKFTPKSDFIDIKPKNINYRNECEKNVFVNVSESSISWFIQKKKKKKFCPNSIRPFNISKLSVLFFFEKWQPCKEVLPVLRGIYCSVVLIVAHLWSFVINGDVVAVDQVIVLHLTGPAALCPCR